MFNGCLDFQNSTFLLGLLADIDFSLVETDHDSRNLGSTNDSGEHGAGSIVTSETCLASARTIIDDYSRYLFVHYLLNFTSINQL